MKHPLTQEQLQLLNEYRQSNLTKKNFCLLKEIKLHKLDYLIVKEKSLQEDKTEIVKLNYPQITSSALTIDLKDLTITIQNGFDASLLKELMKVFLS